MSRGGPSASRDGEPQMRTFAGLDKERWEKVNEVMKPAVLELALRCKWRGVITSTSSGDQLYHPKFLHVDEIVVSSTETTFLAKSG